MNRTYTMQSILGAAVTVIWASPAYSQSCGDIFQLPVSKAQLNAIAANLGIVGENAVEKAFEKFSLGTIQGVPLNPIPENRTPFPSIAREAATGGRFKNVVPDGVLPLIVVKSPIEIRQYQNSVFYEAKAVTNDSLPPSAGSDPYQILGFIDALRRSTPAGQANDGVPAIVFMTTNDVVPLSWDTRLIAYGAGVSILHSIVCKPVLFAAPGTLQLGPAEVLVPESYLNTGNAPAPVGPGARADLQNYAP
jgi:hypothetical protein